MYNGHPWDTKIEAVVGCCSEVEHIIKIEIGLLMGGLCRQVAVIQRWSLAQV